MYIGNLGNNASKYDIEDAFTKYGPLRDVWVARNPPGFAFVEFEDNRDAKDAVRGLDGTRLCGVSSSLASKTKRQNFFDNSFITILDVISEPRPRRDVDWTEPRRSRGPRRPRWATRPLQVEVARPRP